MRLRSWLLGDPSLTPAERRARADAMWRNPRFVVPYALCMGVVLVLIGGADAGWPQVVLWVLVGAAVMAVVSLVTGAVVDPPARRPRP